MVESIAKKSSNRKVGELISKVVISVDEQASLMECVDI